MNKLIFSILLSAVGLTAGAEPWSLDSCISYATEHNLTVMARRVSLEDGRLGVTEARDKYLPTLSAGVSQDFSFGRGLTSENTYANRSTSSFNWGATMRLPLFQGLGAYRGEQLAKANLQTMLEQLEAAKEDVTLNVMAAYLQVLYCREIHAVALETVRLSEVELERRKVLLEAGKIPELDLTQARSQLAADRLSAVNADNDVQLAKVALARLLRLPSAEGFEVAPLSESDSLGMTLNPEDVYHRALEANHSLAASRAEIVAADRQIDVARTGYIPTLSFNLSAGSTYYALKGEQNPSFGRQMRDNYATGLGFSLSIPIFDAFSTRNSIRRAKVRKVSAELDYATAADNVHNNIIEAYYQAVGAGKALESSDVAREAAREAFEAMTEKYNFGRANATEFEQAKSAYLKSVADSVRARYELIMRNRILAFYNR